jgi:hypothetical protein
LRFTSNEAVAINIQGGSFDAINAANNGQLFYINNRGTTYHTVTISSSPIFKSAATINDGALFYLYNVIYKDIEDPTIYYNSTSTTRGGAFSLYASNVTIEDAQFYNMGSPLGGVFYLNGSIATISSSTFTSINCSNIGGIFY